MNVLFVNRLNQNWIADLGIGFTAYGLILSRKIDKYVIDFASPNLSAGVSYNFQHLKGNETFFKFSTGFQVGHQRRFVDEFDTYKVTIQGENKLYQFLRVGFGFRRYFKQKMKGTQYKAVYEVGTYFRYNLNTLGTVNIEEGNFETNLEPRGNISTNTQLLLIFSGFFFCYFPLKNKPIAVL